MTLPVIWIPFRGDDGGWRDGNFEAVLKQAESTRMKVIVHDSGDEPFSIARTWNECAAMSPAGWTHAVRWAADFLLDPVDGSLEAAIAVDHHYVFPFDKCITLDQEHTRMIHRGETFIRPPETKLLFGGVNVTSREMWDDVGGFDERFVGYGFEDMSFRHAMDLLWGEPVRVEGRLYNLWHPRKDYTVPYWAARAGNLARYQAEYLSIDTAEEMRAYIDARKSAGV